MVSTMDLVRYKTCAFKHIIEQVCEHKMDLKDYFKLKETIKKLSISDWHKSGHVLFKLKQQSIYKRSTTKGNSCQHKCNRFHKSSHKTKVTKSMGICWQVCVSNDTWILKRFHQQVCAIKHKVQHCRHKLLHNFVNHNTKRNHTNERNTEFKPTVLLQTKLYTRVCANQWFDYNTEERQFNLSIL